MRRRRASRRRSRAARVGSFEEAAAALAGIAEYFSRAEPSSPALLLTRQAQALIGKSFLEVMQILVPEKVESAAVQIGAEQPILATAATNVEPLRAGVTAG